MKVKPNPFPCVTVHCIGQALAALAPARPVTLLSASGAACYVGCGWWRALVAAASQHRPGTPVDDILDCADAAGRALEALRMGQKKLVLNDCPAFASVAAAAAECGAMVLAERPPSLDLARPDATRRLTEWLAAEKYDPVMGRRSC